MKDASRTLLRSASSARQFWTIVIFLHLHILIAADPQLRYQQFTKLGYTLDKNKPCLFDCVDGRCRAGESRELVPCRDSGELAPTFHTIRESSHEYCLSNCGKFDKTNYEWCYVDSYDKWDYCSSVTENKMIVDRSFTYDGKACSNECSYYGYHYLWCKTFDDSWGKCDPGVYSYVQAYTARGTPCWGRCEKHTTGELSKHAYNVCESAADISEGCAPPALPIAQLNHMLSCLPETNQCPAIPRRRRRNVTSSRPELPRRSRRNVTFTECVDEVSNNLARIPIMSTRILANPNNPIFSYTMIPAAYTGRPALPVVVRARITPATIRTGPRGDMPSAVTTNLNAMGMIRTGENRDEAGHLIGSQLGGVETIYNVAPQTRRLNRGTGRFIDYPQWRPSVWYHRDENIRSFIDRTNGTADLTVTVRYDLTRSFRPIGFHVSEVLRNPDGSVAYECPDFYYSNDPDHVE